MTMYAQIGTSWPLSELVMLPVAIMACTMAKAAITMPKETT